MTQVFSNFYKIIAWIYFLGWEIKTDTAEASFQKPAVSMKIYHLNMQFNWHFLLIKNKLQISCENDKAIKIMIKTEILSWQIKS